MSRSRHSVLVTESSKKMTAKGGTLYHWIPACAGMTTHLFAFYLFLFSIPVSHAGQPIKTYEEARPIFWQNLYPDGGETFYCQQKFGPGYNQGINIEHVFPMSWVAWKLKCGKRQQCRDTSEEFNLIEADLHNLYPARADINEERSSHAFAMIEGERREYGSCDIEIDKRSSRIEPRPEVRGKIARAMLYMVDRYDLYLKDNLHRLLLEWHEQNPADDFEKQRNEKIFKIQGNRNHWIN